MNDEKQGGYDALNTRSLAAKREYVRGLEQRRDTEAISLLVECLCDESWYLRQLAEQAFLRIGGDSAPVLLPLLDGGLWFTRSSAASVLGRIGCVAAVPGLLQLTGDKNRAVADTAREALLAIGRASGAVRIAHVLHRLAPDVRQRHLVDFAARDAELAGRVTRLLANAELMAVEDGDLLTDDHPVVRASEDGVEWELLTGPAPASSPPAPPAPPAPARREDDGTERT
jgi:HEAT repeat protein